jgi:outer membrane protein OmpA-like peptidoglycan-associated protein
VTSTGPPHLPDLQYNTGDATLGAQANRVLWEVLQHMREDPELRLLLRGHADHRGEETMNDTLSRRRAEAAAEFLRERGVDASRLDVVGVGERDPAIAGESPAALRRNRRVQVIWR